MTTSPSREGRSVVLLQGPVGPFFAFLQRALEARGWRALRLVFNAGDEIYAGRGRTQRFDAPQAEWVDRLAAIFREEGAEAVLMFGDQRPIHLAAKEAAARVGARVMSFEEGYLRPDFVTLEPGGNNACSPLRAWRPGGEVPPPPHHEPLGGAFAVIAWYATRYFVALHLGRGRYPHYEHHRRRHPMREAIAWWASLGRKIWRLPANRAVARRAVGELAGRHMILALQVFDDLQLRRHGRGWTVGRLIDATLASFARAAPAHMHLLVKGHPLDRGHTTARAHALARAAALGLADRVHYLDDGALGPLSQASLGMVTINSTSALVAFAQGKPVFAFGDAFYDGLTANRDDRSLEALDRFWSGAPGMEREIWLAFAGTMARDALVHGSYYRRDGLAGTCARVVERLERLLAPQVESQFESKVMPDAPASGVERGRAIT